MPTVDAMAAMAAVWVRLIAISAFAPIAAVAASRVPTIYTGEARLARAIGRGSA